MNYLELNQMLSTLLADSSLNFYTDAERKQALNNACNYINSEIRICANVQNLTVAALESKVLLPYDFIMPLNGADWIDLRNQATALEWTPVKQIRTVTPNWEDEKGIPSTVVTEGGNIYLYPTPTAGGTLRLSYVCRPNVLSADTDTPFFGDVRIQPYHDALVHYAAWQLSLKDRDFEAGQMFWSYFQSRFIDLKEALRFSASRPAQVVWADTYSTV